MEIFNSMMQNADIRRLVEDLELELIAVED